MTALNDIIVERTRQTTAEEPTLAGRRRDLVRAAVAIVVEIERMDRLSGSVCEAQTDDG